MEEENIMKKFLEFTCLLLLCGGWTIPFILINFSVEPISAILIPFIFWTVCYLIFNGIHKSREKSRINSYKKSTKKPPSPPAKKEEIKSPILSKNFPVLKDNIENKIKEKQYSQTKTIINVRDKCYTYFIGWSKLEIYYYGIRVSAEREPEEDLWKNYFTSSYPVYAFRVIFGEPDIIKIHKKFGSDEYMTRQQESKMIKYYLENSPNKVLNEKNIEWVRNYLSQNLSNN